MGKIQSSIEGVRAPASYLESAFGMVGDAIGGLLDIGGNFASWVGSVLTYTLGGLLTDAIEGVVNGISEMVSKTIEAGNEFQTLKLRLNGLNLNDLIQSGMDYNEAVTESVRLTQEQLAWLQKLAAATPFDNADISNIYTLARGYGFTNEEAMKLTETTADFTSGMGLSEVEMKRIIINLGQMKAAGKITGREMTDLARGAFFPLSDVMKRVASIMNISVEELNAMRAAGEAIDPDLFVRAYEQMVAEEPRFAGAAERMARTFGAATDNVMDLATSFGGLNIAAPILDVLGGKIADFMDNFIHSDEAGQSYTELGQRLLAGAQSIGASLVIIVDSVLGLMGPTEDVAGALVSGIEGVADWLRGHKFEIIEGIQSIWNKFIEFGQSDFVQGIISNIQKIPAWLSENKEGILSSLQGIWNGFLSFQNSEFVKTLVTNLSLLNEQLFKVNENTGTAGWQDLLEAVGNVASAIGGVLTPILESLGIIIGEGTKPNIQGFVDALNGVANWIRENQELLTTLVQIFIAFQVVQTAINLISGFVVGLVVFGITVYSTIGILSFLMASLTTIILVISAVMVQFGIFELMFKNLGVSIQFGTDLIVGYFRNMQENLRIMANEVFNAWNDRDWGGIGWAIINGIARGISMNLGTLMDAVRNAALAAYNNALSVLGIHSPSKLFSDVGGNMMKGMAQGITDSASAAVSAMQTAVGAVSMPAMTGPTVMQQYSQMAPSSISNTYQTSNSYNLQVNTSAKTEPIISDFRMLESMG